MVFALFVDGNSDLVDQEWAQINRCSEVPRPVVFDSKQSSIWVLVEMQVEICQQLADGVEIQVQAGLDVPVVFRLASETLYSLYILDRCRG